MGKKTVRLLVCLGLCALLLPGFAFAEPARNFVDSLAEWGFEPSDAETMAHALVLEERKEALDVAITVEGLYYDGERLLISWRTENLRPEEPALVLYTDVYAGDTYLWAVADHPTSSWWPRVFGLFVAGDPVNGLTDWFWIEDAREYDLQGEVEIAAHFTIKRPTKPMVIVDPMLLVPYRDEGTETDRQAMLEAMRACGVTIASYWEEMDPGEWQEQGYLVVDRYGEHYLADESEGRNALTGMDLPDAETQEIVIAFTVDLDALTKR